MSNETEQKDCLHCIKVFFFFFKYKENRRMYLFYATTTCRAHLLYDLLSSIKGTIVFN